jgi:hypothetical protein
MAHASFHKIAVGTVFAFKGEYGIYQKVGDAMAHLPAEEISTGRRFDPGYEATVWVLEQNQFPVLLNPPCLSVPVPKGKIISLKARQSKMANRPSQLRFKCSKN